MFGYCRNAQALTLHTSAMTRFILIQPHTFTTGGWPVQAGGQITVGQWCRKVQVSCSRAPQGQSLKNADWKAEIWAYGFPWLVHTENEHIGFLAFCCWSNFFKLYFQRKIAKPWFFCWSVLGWFFFLWSTAKSILTNSASVKIKAKCNT